jgi:hypothetical protein
MIPRRSSLRLHGFQLGDLDPDFIRFLDQAFLGEGIRPGGGDFAAQRHRVTAIQEDEMAAHRQFPASAQDQSVLDGTWDFPDIHDPVRANQIFSGHGIIHR